MTIPTPKYCAVTTCTIHYTCDVSTATVVTVPHFTTAPRPRATLHIIKAALSVLIGDNWRQLENPIRFASPEVKEIVEGVFGDVWDETRAVMDFNPGLEAKTLFDEMRRR